MNAPEDWPEKFLEAYRKNGNISQSAKTAKVNRLTVQRHRNDDPAFAEMMVDAQEEAMDALEQEAWRRAKTGTLKPVFYKGEECGQVREYSDTLLTVLLKGGRPAKFRENSTVDVTSGGEKLTRIEIVYAEPLNANPNADPSASETAPGAARDHSELPAV